MPLTNVKAEEATKGISIEPSKVKNTLTINCAGHFTYKIVSVLGKEVLKGTGNNPTELQLQNLTPGVYVVEVITDNGTQKKVKIVKE